jgi:hypothetical protein
MISLTGSSSIKNARSIGRKSHQGLRFPKPGRRTYNTRTYAMVLNIFIIVVLGWLLFELIEHAGADRQRWAVGVG